MAVCFKVSDGFDLFDEINVNPYVCLRVLATCYCSAGLITATESFAMLTKESKQVL